MKRLFSLLICTMLTLSAAFAAPESTLPTAVREAQGVIERTFGVFPKNIDLRLVDRTSPGRDRFAVEVRRGRLVVEGSSTVALCHGFYDYVLSHGYGVCSWTGNRFELPEELPTEARHEVCSPFERRLYMNVCTFGYTSPFWNWEEWEHEIDWMALHGFDMPLAPIGGEAILARVWRGMGLTDPEIDELFTGPAHLPWMRMGNMSGLDGAPSATWHVNQIALQHRILDRMQALGMTPVLPGFAGFVPPAMKRIHPEAELTQTKWSGFRNWMLSPLSPLFTQIGSDYIRAWEQAFGKGKYYLIDSFNELDIPFGEQGSPERAATLEHYGKTIYESLRAANPDAVWVMQGWMFGYQRKIWDAESVRALLQGAPDGKMQVIDLAVDFNNYIWRSENSWNYLSGFFGKDWIYSTVPNFGGRTALIGDLEFYANGHLTALQSPHKNRLTGFGTSPEGVENNEVVYELISAAGWSDRKIDVTAFLRNYSAARYGVCPDGIARFWEEMRRSAYGDCTNDARFRWQLRPFSQRTPSMNTNAHYYAAIEAFLSCADTLHTSDLYRTDALQYAALYLCAKADILLYAAHWAELYGDGEEALAYAGRLRQLLLDADRLLASHPILRLDRWCGKAEQAGCDAEEKARFVGEARRLISVWGGPSLSDYSARVWSGLIRDYYVPRLEHYCELKRDGAASDFRTWDEGWYAQRTPSSVAPFADPLAAARRLVAAASDITEELIRRPADAVAFWSPYELAKERSTLRFSISWQQFERLRGIRITPVRGEDAVTVKEIRCSANGYTRLEKQVDITLNPNDKPVEILLEKLDAPAPLSKIVSVSIRLDHPAAARSYAAIELIY